MEQEFIDFLESLSFGNLALGMARSALATMLPGAKNSYVPAGYTMEDLLIDEYDNGLVRLLFTNFQLEGIEINLGQLDDSYEPTNTEYTLGLNWLWYAKLVKYDEFLLIGKEIKSIQILRVMHHKGWIGSDNEVLLIKPQNFFFTFFADESLALRRIETTMLPLPNYAYEDITHSV